MTSAERELLILVAESVSTMLHSGIVLISDCTRECLDNLIQTVELMEGSDE